MVEPGRSRWKRRVWDGFKNGPLFFQVRQVKEPGYSVGNESPAGGLGWGGCGLVAGLVGLLKMAILDQVTYVCGFPRTHSMVAWRAAFSLCHGR